MSGYATAWLIAAAAASGAALLAFVALRRLRHWRYLAAALVLAWALTPVSFDGKHLAPAFLVATFRQFLEDGVPSAPAWRVLLLGTVAVLALYFAGLGVHWLLASRRRQPQV